MVYIRTRVQRGLSWPVVLLIPPDSGGTVELVLTTVVRVSALNVSEAFHTLVKGGINIDIYTTCIFSTINSPGFK